MLLDLIWWVHGFISDTMYLPFWFRHKERLSKWSPVTASSQLSDRLHSSHEACGVLRGEESRNPIENKIEHAYQIIINGIVQS